MLYARAQIFFANIHRHAKRLNHSKFAPLVQQNQDEGYREAVNEKRFLHAAEVAWSELFCNPVPEGQTCLKRPANPTVI